MSTYGPAIPLAHFIADFVKEFNHHLKIDEDTLGWTDILTSLEETMQPISHAGILTALAITLAMSNADPKILPSRKEPASPAAIVRVLMSVVGEADGAQTLNERLDPVLQRFALALVMLCKEEQQEKSFLSGEYIFNIARAMQEKVPGDVKAVTPDTLKLKRMLHFVAFIDAVRKSHTA